MQGNELTRTQRKAEKVKNGLQLPVAPAAAAAVGQISNRLVVQVMCLTISRVPVSEVYRGVYITIVCISL